MKKTNLMLLVSRTFRHELYNAATAHQSPLATTWHARQGIITDLIVGPTNAAKSTFHLFCASLNECGSKSRR
jgi:hypothetical protein